ATGTILALLLQCLGRHALCATSPGLASRVSSTVGPPTSSIPARILGHAQTCHDPALDYGARRAPWRHAAGPHRARRRRRSRCTERRHRGEACDDRTQVLLRWTGMRAL